MDDELDEALDGAGHADVERGGEAGLVELERRVPADAERVARLGAGRAVDLGDVEGSVDDLREIFPNRSEFLAVSAPLLFVSRCVRKEERERERNLLLLFLKTNRSEIFNQPNSIFNHRVMIFIS